METAGSIARDKCIGILMVDKRQVYMEKMLRSLGYDTRLRDVGSGELPSEEDEIWQAAVLILPVPVSRISQQQDLLERMESHKATLELCIGGAFPPGLQQAIRERGIPLFDVLQHNDVAVKNAVATAEGTIAELSRLMPVNIEGSHVIVMGYGNCGAPIAEKLYCLGAQVTVVARSKKARDRAHYFGYMDYPMDGEIPFGEADALINTIPALVITQKEIDLLKEDAVVIDIASAPGGCDGDYCRKKGIPYVLALGLPGIYAPKSSGQILLEAMPFGFGI
jgi:dipicolinate synthase subunit A